MLALFFFVIIVAIVLGLIGAVVHGLLWLLFVGILVFILNFVFHGLRLKGKRNH
jgi:hypothetical protein